MKRKKKSANGQYVTMARFESAMTAIKQKFDLIRDTMATKEDIESLATKAELAEVKETLARILRIQESIMKVLDSLEGRLNETKDLPDRVERLEKRVFTPRR